MELLSVGDFLLNHLVFKLCLDFFRMGSTRIGRQANLLRIFATILFKAKNEPSRRTRCNSNAASNRLESQIMAR